MTLESFGQDLMINCIEYRRDVQSNQHDCRARVHKQQNVTLISAVSVGWPTWHADEVDNSSLNPLCQNLSCPRANQSKIFDIIVRLEIGWKFLKSIMSRPCFFNNGVTKPTFHTDVNRPVVKFCEVVDNSCELHAASFQYRYRHSIKMRSLDG